MNVESFRVFERINAVYRDHFEFVFVVFARFPKRFCRLVDQIRNHCRPTGRRDFRVIGYIFEQ